MFLKASGQELEDDTAIQGEVRWAVKWGEAMRIPGIGVMFKDIKKNQHEDFCNRCGI